MLYDGDKIKLQYVMMKWKFVKLLTLTAVLTKIKNLMFQLAYGGLDLIFLFVDGFFEKHVVLVGFSCYEIEALRRCGRKIRQSTRCVFPGGDWWECFYAWESAWGGRFVVDFNASPAGFPVSPERTAVSCKPVSFDRIGTDAEWCLETSPQEVLLKTTIFSRLYPCERG